MNEDLRKAIFAKLAAGSLPHSCTAHQHVSQSSKPAKPYLVLEDTVGENWDTDTSQGEDTVTDLRVFSDYRGDREVKAIMERVRTLFHYQPLTVEGATTVSVQVLSTDIVRNEENGTREGVIRVRALLDDITPTT